jgi:hypothetical protein
MDGKSAGTFGKLRPIDLPGIVALLDEASANYILTIAEREHKTSSQVVGDMVREKLPRQNRLCPDKYSHALVSDAAFRIALFLNL